MSETIAQSSSENYGKSVGTSAVVLAKGGGRRHSGSGVITVGGTINMPRYITVHNNHGSQVLYVGWGSDVSTSNGLPIPAGEHRTLRAWYDDELWAIASGASTDTRVYVLHGKGATTFSPLDLSPALWLDASDESTITESGGAVSQWDDLSGNGYHLTQATASLQPTTGTDTINGLNVLHYDNDSMVSPSLAFTGLTMIAVFRHSSQNFVLLGTNQDLTYAGVGQSGSSLTTLTGNMGTMSLRFDGTPFSGTTRGDIYDELASSTKVVTVELSGSFTNALDPFGYTGDLLRPVGDIAEVIVVDGTLTAQQISDTESYLADKWGITLS
jgi:hypothetical protein